MYFRPQYIRKSRALARPFHRGPIAGLGHGFAIFQPVAVEMLGKIIPGFTDDPFGLRLFREVFLLDDVEPLR
jgi:hypothetical protein